MIHPVGTHLLILAGYNRGQIGIVTKVTETGYELGWPGVNPVHRCSGPGFVRREDTRRVDGIARAARMAERLPRTDCPRA